MSCACVSVAEIKCLMYSPQVSSVRVELDSDVEVDSG